jgi:hypothetical protein
MMGPQARMQAWGQFQAEHPEDAQVIIDLLEKYPELNTILGLGCTGMGRPGMRGQPGMQGRRAARGGQQGPGPGPGMGRMEQRDPEHLEQMAKLHALRQKAFMLGEQYQNAANATEKKKIEAELRQVLDEIYELRLAVMRYRVGHVERRMTQVKDELAKYEKDRKGVIEAWFKELTGEEQYRKF